MSKNILYVLMGFAFIFLGGYITRIKLKTLMEGKLDKNGVDLQLLALGVLMIPLGIAMILHFI